MSNSRRRKKVRKFNYTAKLDLKKISRSRTSSLVPKPRKKRERKKTDQKCWGRRGVGADSSRSTSSSNFRCLTEEALLLVYFDIRLFRQTTQGLCRYLEEEGGDEFKERGVVIGRDHRQQVRPRTSCRNPILDFFESFIWDYYVNKKSTCFEVYIGLCMQK